MNVHLGWHYLYDRQHDRAIGQVRKTLELDTNYRQAQAYLRQAYEQKEMYAEAAAQLPNAEMAAALRKAYASSSAEGYWRKRLDLAKEQSKKSYVSSYEIALIYTELGVVYLNVDPRLDSLRTDSRFPDLLRRVGLTP